MGGGLRTGNHGAGCDTEHAGGNRRTGRIATARTHRTTHRLALANLRLLDERALRRNASQRRDAERRGMGRCNTRECKAGE